ncbi:MAG: thiamine pyrophosphate-dependent enzyme, partial [Desulfobacterales bacterium]|nr:thiamine pyrophosphate-dependent enzyme [Desulfobacterales bacterium]
YGISVSQAKHQAIKDIAIRATSYDMPGVVVDGNDVFEVYGAASKAVSRARAGEGPTLIECKTYRWRGHHEGDPNQGRRYRTTEEIEEWKKKDPIPRLAEKLLEQKALTKKKMASIEARLAEEIEQAVAYANESAFPSIEEMFEDVLVKG